MSSNGDKETNSLDQGLGNIGIRQQHQMCHSQNSYHNLPPHYIKNIPQLSDKGNNIVTVVHAWASHTIDSNLLQRDWEMSNFNEDQIIRAR